MASELESPLAERRAPLPVAAPFNENAPRTDDPAWQRPTDPLGQVDASKQGALVIQRQIPLSTIQTRWTISEVQGALDAHVAGQFDLSAQLIDAIIGDDRVQATLGSRTGGLFGRPVKHTPANDSKAAREVCDAWRGAWPLIAPEPVLSEMQRWTVMAGFNIAQILWDTSGPLWIPHVRPWHLRYTFYLPQFFTYVGTTQDSAVVIKGGDGRWILHAPHGEYRGWMRGAVRAVAQPWLIRNFAYRDWARYSERHGMPILRAYEPAAGDPEQKDRFARQLQNLGQESALRLPRGVDEQYSYDVDMLETSDQSWQSFPGLIDRCDMSIVLAILYQNLTTEVTEGSFAAARVHGDVRQSALAADNRALKHTIRAQLARPFAAFNFGDPDLAPETEWEIDPIEDREGTTKVFDSFAASVFTLRRAGYEVEDPEEIKRLAWNLCGLRLGTLALKKVEPLGTGGTGGAGAGVGGEAVGGGGQQEAK